MKGACSARTSRSMELATAASIVHEARLHRHLFHLPRLLPRVWWRSAVARYGVWRRFVWCDVGRIARPTMLSGGWHWHGDGTVLVADPVEVLIDAIAAHGARCSVCGARHAEPSCGEEWETSPWDMSLPDVWHRKYQRGRRVRSLSVLCGQCRARAKKSGGLDGFLANVIVGKTTVPRIE